MMVVNTSTRAILYAMNIIILYNYITRKHTRTKVGVSRRVCKKMKLVLALLLALSACYQAAEEVDVCAEGSVCPVSYPVQSDPGGGTCDTENADDIRSRIVGELSTLIQDRVSPGMNVALRERYLGQLQRFPADSCAAILQSNPNATSDEYWIRAGDGSTVKVYCAMDAPCGAAAGGGGWMRIMDVNMSDPAQMCPGSFTQLTSQGVRVCTKHNNGYGCDSFFPSSHHLPWSKVCGRVTGYQWGSNDGINSDQSQTLDGVYVDGISLTFGSPSQRTHVWSFIAFIHEAEANCPCAEGFNGYKPDFINDDYFCEAGTEDAFGGFVVDIYPDDPLWDGMQCGGEEAQCCDTAPIPPWFYREFSTTTTDWLEFRVCADSASDDERVVFSVAEIYVQ